MYLFHLRHSLRPMVKRLTQWPFETYDLPKGNPLRMECSTLEMATGIPPPMKSSNISFDSATLS
jgi:hypothetical protein